MRVEVVLCSMVLVFSGAWADGKKSIGHHNSATKTQRPTAQNQEEHLLTEVPDDITTVEALKKWLQRFPEENVVIKLGATWCRPCAEVHPELEAVAQRKAGELRVVTIDIDKLPQLAKALNPRGIVPAIVPIKNDGNAAPEAAIVGFMKDKPSPIGTWLKKQ